MLVHGDNLLQKENHTTKYNDELSKKYLVEIREKYNKWKEDNEALKGPFRKISDNDPAIISKRVQLLNEYKDFIDQQHYAEKFDSRSNLHSSVLEEFLYYLFRDLVLEYSEHALIGKSHAFKDIFFMPSDFADMLSKPSSLVEIKDHDFAIGVSVETSMKCKGQDDYESKVWDIPAVSIECKTYLDKTMLQDVSTAAEQLKTRNPNSISLVVAEWLKLTEAVNLRKFKVDQIYVLRKQKNTDREFRYKDSYEKNPIYDDVVMHLFHTVRSYLESPWEGGVTFGLQKGYLL